MKSTRELAIPAQVAALPRLRCFEARAAFTSFPREILAMRQLETLKMGYPATWTDVPDEIAELEHLRVLRVPLIPNEVLPEAITRLVNLRELDLEGWRLTSLPPTFARLENLEVLKLGSKFAEFPSVLLELSRLRELHAGELPQLPDDLGRLGNLEVLQLFHGKSARLPSRLDRLTKLRVLALIRQELTSVPDAITSLGTWTSQATRSRRCLTRSVDSRGCAASRCRGTRRCGCCLSRSAISPSS